MIWHIMLKDLKRIVRDRKALALSLLMPFLLISILGFSVGKFFAQDISLGTAQIAVVNQDNIQNDQDKLKELLSLPVFSENLQLTDREAILSKIESLDFSKILIEDVLENKEIQAFMTYRMMNEQEAKELLKKGDLTAVVVIPEQFNYYTWLNVFSPFRNIVEIEIWKNPEQGLKSEMVEAVINGFRDRLSASIIAKNVFLEAAVENNVGTKSYEQLPLLMEDMIQQTVKEVRLETIPIEGLNKLSGFQYYTAAMASMFILYTGVYGAWYSLDERRLFTDERLKMAGVSSFKTMAGRFLSTMMFTIIQLGFLFISSYLLFQVKWGNWISLITLTIAISFSIGSLSVFLSSINLITNNEKVTNLFQAIIIPLISFAGGSFIPNTSMPEFIKKIGDFTVNGAALQGYVKMMQGYDLGELQSQFFTLLLFSILMIALAIILVRVKEV